MKEKVKIIFISGGDRYCDHCDVLERALANDTDWEEIDSLQFGPLQSYIKQYCKSNYDETAILVRQPKQTEITLKQSVSDFLEKEKKKEIQRQQQISKEEKKKKEAKEKRELKRLEQLKQKYEAK